MVCSANDNLLFNNNGQQRCHGENMGKNDSVSLDMEQQRRRLMVAMARGDKNLPWKSFFPSIWETQTKFNFEAVLARGMEDSQLPGDLSAKPRIKSVPSFDVVVLGTTREKITRDYVILDFYGNPNGGENKS